jgi:hypothetical protein
MPDQAAQPWLPFEELVDAHWRWRKDPAAEPAYRERLAAFEDEFGEIVDSYWCESVPSAVALSRRPRGRLASRLGPRLAFHRVSDWATKNEPEVAALLHRCDGLTIKIARVLRGPMREIAMQLVVSSATHLLSLVDSPAEHRKNEDRRSALAFERKQLDEARRYYEEVGLRQAQLVYLFAMLVAAVGIAVGTWLGAGRTVHQGFGLAAVLGAAGAVLSVMDRMSGRRRKFELDYELGTTPLVVLGALRPVLGVGFGLIVFTALRSGIVNLDLQGAHTQAYLYGLLSFAAGWSERFAKDVLDAAESTVGQAVRSRTKAAEQQAPKDQALQAGGAP